MCKHKTAMWGGALLASALVVGALAAAPLGATESAAEEQPVDAVAILDEMGIVASEDWAETYPDQYASWLANEDNDSGVDYLEEYPYLATLYAGNAFSKDYLQARGHNFTVEDAGVTLRAPAMANCLSCKSSQMNALISSGDPRVYTLPFEEVYELATEAVGCYTCHENTGDQLVVTNTFLIDALGEEIVNEVSGPNLVCGQCHNEYYFSGEHKAVTLPYNTVEAMHPDAIYAYYNEIGFSDYTDPLTGVKFIKVQHPEMETVLGEGYKMFTYDCADCHMGTVETEDGSYSNHYLVSPLENETLLAENCSMCHEDLAAEVEAIQTAVEEKTNEIGYKLETLTLELAEAVEAGDLSEDDFAAIAELNRKAVFYWDFVFVENSEGAHNSELTFYCLDVAEAACDEALEMLA